MPYTSPLRRKRDVQGMQRRRQRLAPQPDNFMGPESPSLRRHPFAASMGNKGMRLGQFPTMQTLSQPPRFKKPKFPIKFDYERPRIGDPRNPGGVPLPLPPTDDPFELARRQADEAIGGLPLSPEFEAQRRALEDQLAQELTAIGVARDQIPAYIRLITERLSTEQAEGERQTNEGAEARGIYDSTIRTTDLGRVRTGFDRSRQDLASDTARQYSDLAARQSGALTGYQGGIAELLLALAQQQAQDPNAPTPRPGTEPRKRGKKKLGKFKRDRYRRPS